MSRNMRPTTPNLKISSHSVGPTSPPQTPTSVTPVLNRKISSRHLPPYHKISRPVVQSSNIHPLGLAHQFSYTRSFPPEQLSPRSSTSSDDDEDDDDDDENESKPESSASGSPPRSSSSEDESGDDQDDDEEEEEEDNEPVRQELPRPIPTIRTGRVMAMATFTVEELSDFDPMDSDNDRLDIIKPSSFEYPDSDRSRSRTRNPELDRGMMQGLQDLNCSGESDEYDPEEAAHKEFVRKQRELKMQKRRSHGSSIGKRTHSERSDSDKEDLQPLDADMVGSSARRLRRRVGDRRSLQFQDPPPPRIDELEEPDSCEDEIVFGDGETLARELPYYAIEIMEIDSS